MGFIERPRRVLRPGRAASPTTSAAASPANASPRRAATPGRPLAALQERYRPRAADLREAVRRLDAGVDEAARRELTDWLREEYAVRHGDVPVGLFSRCHLGPPYVDHRLDLFGVIVDHYTPADAVPEPFGGARMLVRAGDYALIEVYESGQLLPVLDDGTVVRP
jgi:hypothetical protein